MRSKHSHRAGQELYDVWVTEIPMNDFDRWGKNTRTYAVILDRGLLLEFLTRAFGSDEQARQIFSGQSGGQVEEDRLPESTPLHLIAEYFPVPSLSSPAI
jgi:hypothetical protein